MSVLASWDVCGTVLMNAATSMYALQSSLTAAVQRTMHTGVLWMDMLLAVVLTALMGALAAHITTLPQSVAALARRAWRRWWWSGGYAREFTLVQSTAAGSIGMTTDHAASTSGAWTLHQALCDWLPVVLTDYVDAPDAVLSVKEKGYTPCTDVTHLPHDGVAVVVDDDVELTMYRDTRQKTAHDKNSAAVTCSERTTRVVLRSRRSARSIDAFVTRCLQHYARTHGTDSRRMRYFIPETYSAASRSHAYEVAELERVPPDAPAGAPVAFLGKTFDTLFIPDGARLRSLVADFAARRGRFGRRGLPWRLGFLFSGLPGCGKTSAIEAIAHELHRSVISVPMSRIRTAAQLRSLFVCGDRRTNDDQDKSYKVPYVRAVYVLEDVDAAGDLFLRRAAPDRADSERRPLTSYKKGDRYPDAAAIAAATATAVASIASGGKAAAAQPDEPLTLADVLEMLDGVVKMPGRVVVFTTNHPERLDPALLRPGRVDVRLEFGRMRRPELRAMLAYHYPGTDTPADDALPDGLLTPAEVERAVIEHTELSDVLVALAVAASAAAAAAV